MPAARDNAGIQRPLARDRNKDIGKQRYAKLTAEGSTMIGARIPNDLLREAEELAKEELISTADFFRRALLLDIKKRRKHK
jgi:hypothetical protein